MKLHGIVKENWTRVHMDPDTACCVFLGRFLNLSGLQTPERVYWTISEASQPCVVQESNEHLWLVRALSTRGRHTSVLSTEREEKANSLSSQLPLVLKSHSQTAAWAQNGALASSQD